MTLKKYSEHFDRIGDSCENIAQYHYLIYVEKVFDIHTKRKLWEEMRNLKQKKNYPTTQHLSQ